MVTMRTCALALALAAISGGAAAADGSVVVEISGSVMVNRGESFVPASNGVQIGQGHQVMAMEGGSAIIRFADNCDLKVEPGTVVTLADRSPCAGWIPMVEAVGPSNVALGGGAAAGGAGGAGGGLSGASIAGIAGGAVALGLAADRINDDDEEDDPVSP